MNVMFIRPVTEVNKSDFLGNKHIMYNSQLGTFFVNGEWVCGVCLPFEAKSGPTGAEHEARSQLAS